MYSELVNPLPQALSEGELSLTTGPALEHRNKIPDWTRAEEWIRDKRITGLWTSANDGNVWIYVNKVGWKRIGGSKSICGLAFFQLAASAKESGTRVDYRERDGSILELYVW